MSAETVEILIERRPEAFPFIAGAEHAHALPALSPSVLKSAGRGPGLILAGDDAARSGKNPRDTLFISPGLGDHSGGEAP